MQTKRPAPVLRQAKRGAGRQGRYPGFPSLWDGADPPSGQDLKRNSAALLPFAGKGAAFRDSCHGRSAVFRYPEVLPFCGKTAVSLPFLRRLRRRGGPCCVFQQEKHSTAAGSRPAKSFAGVRGKSGIFGGLTGAFLRFFRRFWGMRAEFAIFFPRPAAGGRCRRVG